jgi:carboxymethylenebutenolidase
MDSSPSLPTGCGPSAAYEAALKASGVSYQMHMYPGTQHRFHNNSTPRYHEVAATLAWERTITFFKKHLA